jgi:crotonobetainyl-CoA:carnitine CoA-transferase CaiB-like acyl-CoA transferase
VLDNIFMTRTCANWLQRLEVVGVPAGPIYKMDEVFADERVRHLGIAFQIHDPVRDDIRLVGQPVVLSRTPENIATPLPEPGEHTNLILDRIL